MISKLLTSSAIVLSLVAVPALAAPANPASRLSVASSPQVRGSTNIGGKSNKAVGGLSVGVIAAIAVGAAAIAAALIVINDDDEDSDSA